MKVTCLAPWFGSNRMLAQHVGQALKDCEWVGVPFAGGMAELVHITARTINVNDLHRHVINLARVLSSAKLGPRVYRTLRRVPFHPESLAEAQQDCLAFERANGGIIDEVAQVRWASAYFAAAWMPRHGLSGTDGEFKAGMSIRWNAGGGDSAKHYWNAVASIKAWRKLLQRCNFTCLDWRQFLLKCKDELGHGVYCDPPFPGPGDGYKHKFTIADHRQLASSLTEYVNARIVCRFYDVPLIRELYPESDWKWNLLEGRKQTNATAPEVLLTKN